MLHCVRSQSCVNKNQDQLIFPRKLHTQPPQTCNPVSMANQHCIVKHLDFCPFWAVAVATLAIVWAHVYCRASVSADFCPKNVQATSLWSIALVCQSPMKTDLTPINLSPFLPILGRLRPFWAVSMGSLGIMWAPGYKQAPASADYWHRKYTKPLWARKRQEEVWK